MTCFPSPLLKRWLYSPCLLLKRWRVCTWPLLKDGFFPFFSVKYSVFPLVHCLKMAVCPCLLLKIAFSFSSVKNGEFPHCFLLKIVVFPFSSVKGCVFPLVICNPRSCYPFSSVTRRHFPIVFFKRRHFSLCLLLEDGVFSFGLGGGGWTLHWISLQDTLTLLGIFIPGHLFLWYLPTPLRLHW